MPAWTLLVCVTTSSSNPPVAGIVTVIGMAAPPGVYELGAFTITPLPAVRVPWQLAQVPCPGALVFDNGGLLPNAYELTGDDRIAANIARTVSVAVKKKRFAVRNRFTCITP